MLVGRAYTVCVSCHIFFTHGSKLFWKRQAALSVPAPGAAKWPPVNRPSRKQPRALCSFPPDREPGQNVHAQGEPRAAGRERVGRALRGEVVLVAVSGMWYQGVYLLP